MSPLDPILHGELEPELLRALQVIASTANQLVLLQHFDQPENEPEPLARLRLTPHPASSFNHLRVTYLHDSYELHSARGTPIGRVVTGHKGWETIQYLLELEARLPGASCYVATGQDWELRAGLQVATGKSRAARVDRLANLDGLALSISAEQTRSKGRGEATGPGDVTKAQKTAQLLEDL